jgi:hypothetical protein
VCVWCGGGDVCVLCVCVLRRRWMSDMYARTSPKRVGTTNKQTRTPEPQALLQRMRAYIYTYIYTYIDRYTDDNVHDSRCRSTHTHIFICRIHIYNRFQHRHAHYCFQMHQRPFIHIYIYDTCLKLFSQRTRAPSAVPFGERGRAHGGPTVERSRGGGGSIPVAVMMMKMMI